MTALHDAIRTGTVDDIVDAIHDQYHSPRDFCRQEPLAIAEAIVAARPEITASDYIAAGIDLKERIEILEAQLATLAEGTEDATS